MTSVTYRLTKESDPCWTKLFSTEDERIDELRSHICKACLQDGETDDTGYTYFFPADTLQPDGTYAECREFKVLMQTPCGCEFSTIDPDAEVYYMLVVWKGQVPHERITRSWRTAERYARRYGATIEQYPASRMLDEQESNNATNKQ